jgi:beta-1,4-mannosyl-glycoprotein beta-1,4-N-acetylglucosaminyltransferase
MPTGRLYDCCTFSHETELLRLRLETLRDVADFFVIAEGTHTFNGEPKALNFDIERFADFRERIRYIVVDDMPLGRDLWANERHQRNSLARGLHDARDEDRVLVSDLDEIARPEAVLAFEPSCRAAALIQDFYCFFLNNLAVEAGNPLRKVQWDKASITTAGQLRGFFKKLNSVRYRRPPKNALMPLRRLGLRGRIQRIPDAGWHFSWTGGVEAILRKHRIFVNMETGYPETLEREAILETIRNGADALGVQSVRYRRVPVDGSLPPYLRAHLADYRHMLLDPDEPAEPFVGEAGEPAG